MRTMVVGGKKNAAEGVSLKFLREFAAKVDGEMSTVQVVAQYIMPVTKGKLPKKFVATMNAAQLGEGLSSVQGRQAGIAWDAGTSIEEVVTNSSATPPNPLKIFFWIDIFAINQNPAGYREIKCVHTSSTENIKDDSTEVRHDLKVKITAAGELFAIKLGGEIGYEYANLVRQSNSYKVFTSVEQTDILHVDISAPCYVYQLESTAKMTDSSHVTLWGNMFVVNKAIKSRLISGSQDPSQLAHITVQKTSGGHPSTYRGHVRSRNPQPERPQPQMQPERPQLQQHVRQQPSAAQSQLVQCPQCHNHLPVPLGTSDFSCGGCGLEMQMPGTGQQQQQASPAHGQYTTVICPSCHNRLNVPHGTHIFTCGGCGTGMHM
eukprot:gene16566-22796_t